MSAENTEPSRPATGQGSPSSPRPHAVAAVVPTASVPLSFLAAAAAGLAGCGLALTWASRSGAADRQPTPLLPPRTSGCWRHCRWASSEPCTT
jgi:hypothetical protein